ncbi:MAG: ATP-binding cassette domain-containing protein [Blautia sp.]|jgi:ribose transport system ATP-binding protein
MQQELLRFENVSAEDNGRHLFCNLNVSIFKNARLGIANTQESDCTALAGIISGLFPISHGRIIYHGQIYSPQNYNTYSKNAMLKINDIFKQTQLVPAMSITENLFALRSHSFISIFNKKAAGIRTQQLLDKYLLPFSPDAKIASLSRSQQHLIQILKALDTGAEILILDNITRNYTPTEKELLLDFLSRVEHCAILYISNTLDSFFETMDSVVVMKKGQIIHHIFPSFYSQELLTSIAVGKNTAEPSAIPLKSLHPAQDTVLKIGLPGSFSSLTLKRHEVLGIIDLNGSLYQALNQLELYSSSYPITCGKLPITSYRQAAKCQCYFLTERHIQEGLFPTLSFKKNLTILSAKKTSYAGILSDRLEDHLQQSYLPYFEKETPPFSKWGAIKTMLFRYLSVRPQIVILGINPSDIPPSSQEEFYQIIGLFRKHGVSLLMIYVDDTEYISLCDRLLLIESNFKVTERHTDQPIPS